MLIKEKYSALAEAARAVATPQLRNVGTIAGNLCQDVRCWYYRRSPITGTQHRCFRNGGTTCYALAGDNRYHSIFGGLKGCYAVSPSDIAPALIALNATMKTSRREIMIGELFAPLSPTTILDIDEIITEIQVPTPPLGAKSTFMKSRLRKAIDFAIVSVAVALTLEDKVCKNAVVALGGVFPTPFRATEVEEALKGKEVTESLVERAARMIVEKAKPLKMNAYKVPMTESLIKKAIATLI